MKPPAAKLPDGVIDLRKVKTRIGGEDGRMHLTWVIAYSAQIDPGSPRHDAIRLFASTLKAPPNTEQSVMLLPVAPLDTSQAPVQPQSEAHVERRAKPRPKRRAKPRAKARRRAPPKARVKPRAQGQPKRRTKTRAKTRAAARPALRRARKTRR